MHQYAVNWDQFHLLLLDLDIPTALRAKREAIVIDFDGRMGGVLSMIGSWEWRLRFYCASSESKLVT